MKRNIYFFFFAPVLCGVFLCFLEHHIVSLATC